MLACFTVRHGDWIILKVNYILDQKGVVLQNKKKMENSMAILCSENYEDIIQRDGTKALSDESGENTVVGHEL